MMMQSLVSILALACLNNRAQALVTPKATIISSLRASFPLSLSSPDENGEVEFREEQVASMIGKDDGRKGEGSTQSPKSAAPLQKQQQQQLQSLSQRDQMTAMGTSPRRIAISLLSASGIALAGNFLGMTSRLLTAVPEVSVP
jgi:hypothetical protein